MAGINAYHCRHYIVRPILKKFELWSPSAENLLLGTAAQESKLGFYIKQIGSDFTKVGGPALGIYQIEPSTLHDIIDNVYLPIAAKNNSLLHYSIMESSKEEREQRLCWDLEFTTIICRLHYCRRKEPLPVYDDIEGLAKYWKKWYNTEKGKGTVEEFIINFKKYIYPNL